MFKIFLSILLLCDCFCNDKYEPNNTQAAAYDLNHANGYEIATATIQPTGESDWYSFTATGKIKMTFNRRNTDYLLWLSCYDKNNFLIAYYTAFNPGNKVVISPPAFADTVHCYIRVYSQKDSFSGCSYGIIIE